MESSEWRGSNPGFKYQRPISSLSLEKRKSQSHYCGTKSLFGSYWPHGSLHLILVGIEICGIKVASIMRRSNIRSYCLSKVELLRMFYLALPLLILSRLSGGERDRPVYSPHLSKISKGQPRTLIRYIWSSHTGDCKIRIATILRQY